MKYAIIIMDGAAGLPIKELDNKTTLEYSKKPYLDSITKKGMLGLTLNIPEHMEPSSAVACMSVMGYDPVQYYSGRGPIEAKSMGIELKGDEAAFRCNLVSIKDGKMQSYCSDHITTQESRILIEEINNKLGSDNISFYPGVSYRHLMLSKKGSEIIEASCTPPHDISGRPIVKYMPSGKGSEFLNDLIINSEKVLKDHPLNKKREQNNLAPANSIWLFWGGQKPKDLPSFSKMFGHKAALSSGVDLLNGIGKMIGVELLEIKGVTGGLDNDYEAQGKGAIKALEDNDLVIVHVEAPDEAGHGGNIKEKINAIEQIDKHIVKRFVKYDKEPLKIMILPDHPTPISTKTHTREPVPFLLYGADIRSNNASCYCEKEASKTGSFISMGHELINKLFL